MEIVAMREPCAGAAEPLDLNPRLMAFDYDSKPPDYFALGRNEMLPFLPPECGRLLDVGCGAGVFGELIKQSREVEVWGVESVPSVAVRASAKLDHVVVGDFCPQNGLPEGTFDCIVFNDVLEHMLEPELALRYARGLLSRNGCIVASIPNIRYLPILWHLAARGEWNYGDSGVWDKTHVRFFTRSSIVTMFENEGYAVQSISGINSRQGIPAASGRLWKTYELVNLLFFRKFDDARFQQFAVKAQPTPTLHGDAI